MERIHAFFASVLMLFSGLFGGAPVAPVAPVAPIAPVTQTSVVIISSTTTDSVNSVNSVNSDILSQNSLNTFYENGVKVRDTIKTSNYLPYQHKGMYQLKGVTITYYQNDSVAAGVVMQGFNPMSFAYLD